MAEVRINAYGIQVSVHQYPTLHGCGIQYAYQIEQGLFINNVGLMVLCRKEKPSVTNMNISVVVDSDYYIRQEPIPLAQRMDTNENSTDIPEERAEPIRK